MIRAMTQHEVAKELNISQARVMQLEKSALKKLALAFSMMKKRKRIRGQKPPPSAGLAIQQIGDCVNLTIPTFLEAWAVLTGQHPSNRYPTGLQVREHEDLEQISLKLEELTKKEHIPHDERTT